MYLHKFSLLETGQVGGRELISFLNWAACDLLRNLLRRSLVMDANTLIKQPL